MAYSVVFTPEARAQLIALYRYIEIDASPAIAQRFTDAIVNHCELFRELPARAVRRDDIRPGLHFTNYRGRLVIAFAVEGQLKLTPNSHPAAVGTHTQQGYQSDKI